MSEVVSRPVNTRSLGTSGNGKPRKRDLRSSTNNSEARSQMLLAAMLAFRDGDFSWRLPSDWADAEGRIAEAFNQTIAQEDRIAREVERLSLTVGRDGRLKQRMSLPGAIGQWATKVDSINTLIDDLVRPTAEIARTIGAVAKGDLGQSMELEADGRALKGEFLRSAKLVNTMIEQLSVFTSEVTRVAREVGTEGKLGGQAQVKGVSGLWKDLTDSVNQMAGNLTAQVRNIAEVTIAVANGDLSKKITVDVRGEILQLKEATNTMVDQLRSFASEVTRVAREVGTDGRLGGQAVVPGVAGTWKDLTDSVNAMATNLTSQVRNIATVTTAVARGDLSRKITVDVKGEILELKETINTMVDQLNGFSSEVTRVAREVGTEGKLGGQAAVPGVAGTWKDLTDNVNFMASNLTGQVRNIADVRDVSDLASQVGGHEVDVVGEILPGAGDAGHRRLAAELAFGADLARHAGDFRREPVELIDHRVDGFLQFQNFALHVDRDLARQIAARHGGGHRRDIADLRGEVGRHRVDRVGEVLPGADHPRNDRLSAQSAVGADLARHARDLRGEGPQLIDHRVGGLLQLQNFAAHVDGDFLRQVAIGDRDGHFGDVAHLSGEIAGHLVDRIGQVLPHSGDALDLSLAAELALGADFPRHAGHFRREHRKLLDHRIDEFRRAKKFPLEGAPIRLQFHGLPEIALGHRADRARDFGGGPHEIVDERIDGVDFRRPLSDRSGQ